MNKFFTALMGIFYLLSVGISVFFYSKLPSTMASHFTASGIANGWMSKEVFFIVFLAVMTLDLGIFLLMPVLFSKTTTMINLPNREYWMHPSREAQTIESFKAFLSWNGVLITILLFTVLSLCIQTNLNSPVKMSPYLGWVIGGYLALIFISSTLFFGKFFTRARTQA